MTDRKRVLVAMSGGVDSSVAACLLKEQGFDVIGVFMRLGTDQADPARTESGMIGLPIHGNAHRPDRHHGCCSALDAADARDVAGRLGIPFYALNFEADFSRLIDYFVDEYAAARTPNPCVMCNQWLKFGRLMEYAAVVHADYIATGHYARIDRADGEPRLLRARNRRKDQSYVLSGVSSDVFRRTLFPIGDLDKDAVRETARRFGLSLHDKPESQDICFVPDRAYERVVRARRPGAFRPGPIRHVDGRVLGEHDGLPKFTIGQRRGVNIAAGHPIYVTELDEDSNTVVVGPREALASDTATASRVNWLAETPTAPFRATVQIRYNHAGAWATVRPIGHDSVDVSFDDPQDAVTPGQALVIYDGDMVIGGGWIDDRRSTSVNKTESACCAG